ncbi:Imm40 family immunity protein [Agrobacterium vitis]|uniref:Imm40 family immunity protein n=1 Tax=Agrobacterium vitis TaxID=373 RepID=UPI0015743E2B|nr:Imm40 family immunity protein [Agrobacterium vitis]NSZ15604.1 hypothetical protein [Agrobacterium vitis]QZO04427.1 hypothetical protein K4831_02335 [Agrobacterium vitis]UJL86569.1 hypothetical protein AVF2S5_00670 [Agrobacterium vitis]
MQNIWSPEVDSILSVGIDLQSIGVNNWALSWNDAINSVQKFYDIGIPIVGLDVYFLKEKFVEQTYESFYVEKNPNESDGEFLFRSNKSVEKFLIRYKNNRLGFYFALVPLVRNSELFTD